MSSQSLHGPQPLDLADHFVLKLISTICLIFTASLSVAKPKPTTLNSTERSALAEVRVGPASSGSTHVASTDESKDHVDHIIDVLGTLRSGDAQAAGEAMSRWSVDQDAHHWPLWLELRWRTALLTSDQKASAGEIIKASRALLKLETLPDSLRARAQLSLFEHQLILSATQSAQLPDSRAQNIDQPKRPPEIDHALEGLDRLIIETKSDRIKAEAFRLVYTYTPSPKKQAEVQRELSVNYGHTPAARTVPLPSEWDAEMLLARGEALFQARSYALALETLALLSPTPPTLEADQPSSAASTALSTLGASDAYTSQRSPKMRQEAALMIAVSLMRLRVRDQEAERQLLVSVEGPDEETIATGWFYLSILWGRLAQWGKALSAVRRYVELHPQGRRAKESRYQVGRLLHQAGRYDEAIEAHRAFLETKPRDRNKYIWFLGWSEYRRGRCDRAREVWRPLIKSHNLLEGPKALYWTARCLFREAEGVTAESNADSSRSTRLKKSKRSNTLKRRGARTLKTLFKRAPLSYYTLLGKTFEARQKNKPLKWKNPLQKRRRAHRRAASPPTPKKTERLLKRLRRRQVTRSIAETLERALSLAELGGERHALTLFASICETASQLKVMKRALGRSRQEALCDAVAMRVGAHGRLWKAQARARIPWRDDFLSRSVSARVGAYPLAYEPLVRAAAEVEGVSPWWLLSHMLQESRYRPRVVSYAQAIGLMQILERTGLRIAQRLGWPKGAELGGFYGDDLFDPALSVRYAAWYLKRLWDDLGHPILAIGAYNGGPMRFADHVEGHPKLYFDELVEELGAHESRNYMRKVTEHFLRYLALYAHPQEWALWIDRLAPPLYAPSPKRSVGF